MARLRNPHPGEILKEEFLCAIGMSQNQLAHTIGVPGNRIHAIVKGTRNITGDTESRNVTSFETCKHYISSIASNRLVKNILFWEIPGY